MQADFITRRFSPYNPAMQTGRPSKTIRSEFGARIHALREAAGLSQAHVAEKLGIAQPTYALWERRTTAIPADQLQRLAEILNTGVDSLFSSGKTTSRRGSGPTGRAKRAFEIVSQLPRSQQQKILDVVEALAAQAKAS